MSFTDDILAKRGTWQLFNTVGPHDLALADSGHIDRQGCLWLRLADALLCTDGTHIIRWHHPVELAYKTKSNGAFCGGGFSRDDKYWWITRDDRLLSLCLDNGIVEDHTDNVPPLHASYWLWTSRHEEILIGCPGKLIRYNGRAATVLDVPAKPDGKIHHATLSPDGDLWLTAHDGLYLLEEQSLKKQHISICDNDERWEIIAQNDKTIWFTCGRRLIHFKNGHQKDIEGNEMIYSVSFRPLLIDNEGNVWIAMHFRGTLVIGKSGMVLFPFEDTPGLSWPKCVVQDKSGAFWLIGCGNGIIRYDPQMLNIIRRGYLEASAMGTDGRLRVTAASKGLLVYDGSSIRQLCETVPTRCFSLFLHPNHDIYIGSPNGMFILDARQATLRSSADCPGLEHIPKGSVHHIAHDAAGHLWLSLPKVLYRCESAGVQAYPHAELGFPTRFFMHQDSAKRLWFFGGPGNPVMRFDANGFTTLSNALAFLTEEGRDWHVNCAAEDRDGRLWIGSSAGHLGRLCMQTGVIDREINIGQATPVRHIRFSDDGQIWISTNSGLFITDGINTYRMTEAALLPTRRIVATYAIANGTILIVTELGLCEYHPRRTVRPQVFIDRVLADQSYPHPGRHLTCESRPELVIFLTALNMKPGPLKYQIRMTGIHDEWFDTWQEEFRFTALPVGTYRFEARAIDQELMTSTENAVVVIDIVPDSRETQIAALEGELHGAEDFAANIIHSMNDAIIVLDNGGRIATVNAAALRLFGYSEGQLTGQAPERLFPSPGVCPMNAAGIERLRRDGQLAARELDMQTLDGKRLSVMFSASCMHDRNDLLKGFVATASDITQYKLMQAQMLQSQKMESLGVLAGGIAHDFNNLLGVMIGNADLVLPTLERGSENYHCVTDIIEAGQQAAKLCSEMLAYAGKGQIVRAPLNVSSIVEHNADLLKSSISRKVVIESMLPDDLPPVWGDETQLMQIVMNLVINAADAIGDNSGVISLSTCVVHIGKNAERQAFFGPSPSPGRYIRLEVKDTGCGMDKATLSRIFEPFFTTKFTGRGLGLSAMHGIVKSHGGALKVESTPGAGTTFQVFLPVYEGSQRPPEVSPPEAHMHNLTPGVVLIVDDEPSLRTITRRMLERKGFDCIEAVDGIDGIAKLEQHQDRIDLVLLDMMMPRMTGLDAYVRMRQIRAELPIIILSGFSESDMGTRFPSDKRLKYLHKPFTVKEVSSMIEDVMQ